MANERRLIDIAPYENMVDASVCRIQVYRSGNGYCDVMNFNTKNIPTVDAVEVVRCAQCYWNDRDGRCMNPKCGKSWYGCPVPDEHFCSYGEKREVE